MGHQADQSVSGVEIFSRHRRALEDVVITPYDFRRPPRPARGPVQALVALHEAFAADLARALSARLPDAVEISVLQVEQMTYGPFLDELPRPTCLSVIRVESLRTAFLLELSPLIAYPLIDRMLGGSSRELFIPQRRMTQIELRLVTRLLETATSVLADAWRPVRALDPRLDHVESIPDAVQIATPDDPVIVVRFDVRTAGYAGPMSLCMSWTKIAPIAAELAGRPVAHPAGPLAAAASADRMQRHVRAAELELTAVLAETTITLDELRELEVGDVIVTAGKAAGPISLEAAGRLRFAGMVGQRNGRRALRLT